jgi:hypothetical protein
MSLNLSWFSTALSRAATLEAIARIAPAGPHTLSLVESPRGTATQVFDGEPSVWAQAISLTTSTLAVSVAVIEDLWSLDVFDGGRHVLVFDNSRDLGSLLGGDVAAVSGLLGAPASLFEQHHRKAKRQLEDDGEGLDPWGHANLLAACPRVAPYPEAGFPASFEVRGTAERWPSLPERLPMSAFAPTRVPSRFRYSSMDGQREALAWAETWLRIAPQLVLEVVEKIERAGARERGVAVRVEWLRSALELASNAPGGQTRAAALIEEWLRPSAMGNANQYLSVDQIKRLALSTKQDGWLPRIEARGEPELAFEEGDYF